MNVVAKLSMRSASSPRNFLLPSKHWTSRIEREFPHFVYVISSGKAPVKIGYADTPTKRLAQLQTGNWQPLELSAVVPVLGAGGVELRAHEIASTNRLHGEWFNLSPLHAVEIVIEAAECCGAEVIEFDRVLSRLKEGLRPRPNFMDEGWIPVQDEKRRANLRMKLGIT